MQIVTIFLSLSLFLYFPLSVGLFHILSRDRFSNPKMQTWHGPASIQSRVARSDKGIKEWAYAQNRKHSSTEDVFFFPSFSFHPQLKHDRLSLQSEGSTHDLSFISQASGKVRATPISCTVKWLFFVTIVHVFKYLLCNLQKLRHSINFYLLWTAIVE